MGLEIEEKGSKVKCGSHNVFAIAYGIDCLCKYGVGTKDKDGNKVWMFLSLVSSKYLLLDSVGRKILMLCLVHL